MRPKLPSWCQINGRSKASESNCCAARSRSHATRNYAASPPKCCGTILPCRIFSRKLGFVCDCCPTPLPYRRCLTLEFCDGSHSPSLNQHAPLASFRKYCNGGFVDGSLFSTR